MARTTRWKEDSYSKGLITYTISGWKYFHDFLEQRNLLNFKTYVYRGQRNENWLLQPSVHRALEHSNVANAYKTKLASHLEEFKFSIRGRLSNLSTALKNDDELWALGQHHGLKTPLLDFTYSPYVAAYFAYIEKDDLSDHRIIWAASQHTVNNQIKDELSIIRPMSGHNPRLLNQSALFVKFNVQQDMETIFKGSQRSGDKEIQLLKIRLPSKDRTMCLKFLNRMNINHNTLFPDLYGSSIFCNTHLEIDKY
jgi:hypothetical protein